MKKYTYYNYSVGLFIGLLSFNIWSSCVHASKQELGGLLSCWRNIKTAQARYPEKAKQVKAAAVVLVLTGASFCGLKLLGSSSYDGNSPSMLVIHNNGTDGNTAEPFTSTYGYSSTMLNNRTDITHLEEVVTKALEKGEEEWGNGTTTEIPSTTTKKRPRSHLKNLLRSRLLLPQSHPLLL